MKPLSIILFAALFCGNPLQSSSKSLRWKVYDETKSVLSSARLILFSHECSRCLDTHPIKPEKNALLNACLRKAYIQLCRPKTLEELLLIYNSCSDDKDRKLVLDMIALQSPEFAITALKYIAKSSNNPDTLNTHLNNLIEEIFLDNPEKLQYLNKIFPIEV